MPHREPKSLKEAAALANDPEYVAATKREMRQEEFERKHKMKHPDEYPERGRAKTQAGALEEFKKHSPYEEEAQVQRYKKKLYKSFSY